MAIVSGLRVSSLCIVLYACFLFWGGTESRANPKYAPAYPNWLQVYNADRIVVGTLVSPQVKNLPEPNDKTDYVSLVFKVNKRLKGVNSSTIHVLYPYVLRKPYPTLEKLFKGKDDRYILFLTKHPELPDTFFTIEDEENYIRSDPRLEDKIAQEINNQRSILMDFSNSKISKSDLYDPLVARLRNQLTKPTTQKKAFSELLGLKLDALPAIVRQMYDPRPVGEPHVEILEGPETGINELTHFGPEVVTDILAIVAQKISHAKIYGIDNGGTEKQRKTVVDAWKLFVSYNMPSG